jgi:hypothetical protein
LVYLLLVASANGGNWASPLGAFVGSNPTVYTILLTHTEARMKKLDLVKIVGTILVATLCVLGSKYIRNNDNPSVEINQGGFNYRDPDSTFDASKLNTNQTQITWRVVPDVQKACEAESRNLGNKGFGYMVQACSFWAQTTCTIITGKNATMHQLGHETLHCFKGNFH